MVPLSGVTPPDDDEEEEDLIQGHPYEPDVLYNVRTHQRHGDNDDEEEDLIQGHPYDPYVLYNVHTQTEGQDGDNSEDLTWVLPTSRDGFQFLDDPHLWNNEFTQEERDDALHDAFVSTIYDETGGNRYRDSKHQEALSFKRDTKRRLEEVREWIANDPGNRGPEDIEAILPLLLDQRNASQLATIGEVDLVAGSKLESIWTYVRLGYDVALNEVIATVPGVTVRTLNELVMNSFVTPDDFSDYLAARTCKHTTASGERCTRKLPEIELSLHGLCYQHEDSRRRQLGIVSQAKQLKWLKKEQKRRDRVGDGCGVRAGVLLFLLFFFSFVARVW